MKGGVALEHGAEIKHFATLYQDSGFLKSLSMFVSEKASRFSISTIFHSLPVSLQILTSVPLGEKVFSASVCQADWPKYDLLVGQSQTWPRLFVPHCHNHHLIISVLLESTFKSPFSEQAKQCPKQHKILGYVCVKLQAL